MRHFIRKFALAACVSGGLFGTLPAAGQGVPTIDPQNLAQQVQQIRHMLEDQGIQTEQLDALLEQIKVLQEQYARLQALEAALTGEKDILALLMGGKLDCLLKRDFNGILNTLQAGLRTGDWASLIEDSCGSVHKSIGQVMAEAGFPGGKVQEMAQSGNPGAERVARQATTGAMVAAVAEEAYARSGVSAERFTALAAEIPNQPDVKAATDHNSRIMVEVGITLLQLVQLQSMQTVGDGLTGVSAAAQMAEEKQFMDLTMPELN
ncbi:type IV secretion system protein [Paracoccus sp. (in: a-proteobacteria)]|uniref:type IV secretion system protein n=1 Tax=Paracoccus sp. TaxID=267 RepID=UPI0026DF7BC8|nr:type IV secretion system protein [Paracoccus sp. (in: a-proteobacteria)]MDO5370682.1 type IV secretion system protein [Paracoccus sp. (in: a-proteobacteria)]